MSKQARVGTGQFQWNIGAWVGSVFGGTLWMFGLGVSAFYFGHAIVSATILCCATMAVPMADLSVLSGAIHRAIWIS
jgi:hypothetical protein